MTDETHQPDSQKQRWLKYGLNVAVSSVIAIALAVLIVYAAQLLKKRVDTTTAGQYSLKPQTKQILNDVKQPIRLVSLYSAPTADDAKARSGTESDADREARAKAVAEKQMKYDVVGDLIEEYARAGKNVKAEKIDPLAEPSKVDALVEEITNKYGGEVKKYREFLDTTYKKEFADIKKAAAEEAAAISKLNIAEASDDSELGNVALARNTVLAFPAILDRINKLIEKPLQQKPPDYKGAVDAILNGAMPLPGMEGFDANVEAIIDSFKKSKDSTALPADVKQYIAESLPRYEALKKQTANVVSQIKGLGELKLDTLRQSLSARDSILVLGDNDIKVITSDQVWKDDVNRRAPGSGPQLIKPKFAGEQQLTSAILALTQKPKKVAFVRPGGPPLAQQGIPGFQRGGIFGSIAERLRGYNFDVIEKDLSGMYAMQAQMQGQQVAPEASDEELKDALWIVLSIPTGNNPMGMQQSIAPKVLEHLNQGGSALVLAFPNADGLSEAFADWGVKVVTDKVIIHEPALSDAPRSSDYIEEAKKMPVIFSLTDYGDHLLAKPLNGLEGIFPALLPVTIETKPGVKATHLLPVPQTPKAWAESDVQSALSGTGDQKPTFDPKTDDGPPLFAGAALEREGKGRLVVIGSMQFATDELVDFPDPDMLGRGVYVSRFPANGELVANSIFWLAKMEPMIAISPAAMEVSRIGPISPAVLKFWRVGVLLIGLPALVAIVGLAVYANRRD